MMMGLNSNSSELHNLLNHSTLIKQGAEAKVYKISLIPNQPPLLLKYRFPKTYRHPSLDTQLTRQRLTFEARALVRAAKSGICVPGLRAVDLRAGWLMIEWIEGWSVREILDEDNHLISTLDLNLDHILDNIGLELAKMHMSDLIHGDLTTSNMLIRRASVTPMAYQVVLIDFGLSSVSNLMEDRAVDLYVLERAFLSTHPDRSSQRLKHSSVLFERILAAYGTHLSNKDWNALRARLAAVRARGRKRSMVG